MTILRTFNYTAESQPSKSQVEALAQYQESGVISAAYLHQILGGSFSTTDAPFIRVTPTELPPLVREMVADQDLVAATEEGWRAIQEGRHSPLSSAKRRLGDR